MNRQYIFGLVLLLFISCRSNKKDNTYVGENVVENIVVLDVDINLKGRSLQVNEVITFKGSGCIYNGEIIGNGAQIIGPPCFESVNLKGKWNTEEMNLGWFVRGENPVENYQMLCMLSDLDIPILIDQKYKISDPTPASSHLMKNDLVLHGISKETSGLELVSLHKPYKAYFDLSGGHSLIINKIKLKTAALTLSKQHYSFVYSDFSSCKHIEQNEISISNSIIEGNIKMAFNPSYDLPTFYTLKYAKVTIENNEIINSVNVLSYSNIGYDSLFIKDNLFKNVYGPTLSFGIFGKDINGSLLYENRKYGEFSDNVVFNEQPIIPLNKTYVSALIAKGKSFNIVRNRISNVLSLTPVSTYAFYASSSGLLTVKGNIVKNCGSVAGEKITGKSCLLKLKGSKNAIVENNEFSFEKEAYQILTKGGGRMNLCLWDTWNSGLDTVSALKIKGNVFDAWMLTENSRLFSSTVDFSGNIVTIENLKFNDESIKSLLYLRGRMAKGDFNLVDNTINVKNTKEAFYILKSNVNNKEFETFTYKNNTYNTPSDPLLQIPRAKEIKLGDLQRGGREVKIQYLDPKNQKRYK